MVVSLVKKLHSTDWSGLNCCFSELFRDCAGSKLLLHKKADVCLKLTLYFLFLRKPLGYIYCCFIFYFFMGADTDLIPVEIDKIYIKSIYIIYMYIHI